MGKLLAYALVVMLAGTIMASGEAEAQGRLGNEGGGGNETANQTQPPTNETGTEGVQNATAFASDVHVFVTDNILYGFTKDEIRNKRLGNVFSVYINPLNGSIDYRILVDDFPLDLGNGDTIARTGTFVEEKFELPNVARINLVVEIIRGDTSEMKDFGLVRLRPIGTIANEVDDGSLTDKVVDQLRQFTPGEWTWYSVKWGLVGLAAIALAMFAAIQRSEEVKSEAQPYTIAG